MQSSAYDPRSARAHNPAFQKALIGMIAFVVGLLLGVLVVSGPQADRVADGQVFPSQALPAESASRVP